MDSRIRELMMRKIWKIPVYLIIAFVGVSIVTAGVMYTLRIPSTITILPPEEGTYEIRVYEDEACTTEITSFDFGEVKIPGNSSVHFYVKSFCTVPIAAYVSIDPYVAGLNHKVWIVHENDPLQPDDVREITFTLLAEVEAIQGTYNFDMVLKVYPA